MKTINDLLNNLPESKEEEEDLPGLSIEDLKKYHYNIIMQQVQVTLFKELGISKCREGEIKKM